MFFSPNSSNSDASVSKKQQSVSENEIVISLGKISYVDTNANNDNELPVILMLHGNSNDKQCFNAISAALSNNFRCIAIDLLGHGSSSACKNGKYDYSTHAQAVAEVIEELKLKDVKLLGFSLGGDVAYELLDNKKVASVITLGSPPISKIKSDAGTTHYDHPNWYKFAGSSEQATEQTTEQAPEKFNIMKLMEKDRFTKEEAEFWVQATGIGVSDPEYASQIEAAMKTATAARPGLFEACMTGVGGDHNAAIRNSSKPVVMMLGEHDQIDSDKLTAFGKEVGKKDGKYVETIIIPGGGHYAAFGASREVFMEKLNDALATLQKNYAPTSAPGMGK